MFDVPFIVGLLVGVVVSVILRKYLTQMDRLLVAAICVLIALIVDIVHSAIYGYFSEALFLTTVQKSTWNVSSWNVGMGIPLLITSIALVFAARQAKKLEP